MPKGVYQRKRKAEPEPVETKEEELTGSDAEEGQEEEEEEGDGEDSKDKEESGEEGKQRKRRRKKRKALFTREKPARRQRAIERAQERAQRIKDAKERAERGEPEPESEEKEEEKELLFPQPSKEALLNFSPLQLLLDHLIRTFHRKDPEEYWVWPVTEEDAPGYSEAVPNQMNYLTMRTKIDRNEYESLNAFKADIDLILKNALAYNKPNTVYWAAARKLEQMTSIYFSKNYLSSLAQKYSFVREISPEELGMSLPEPVLLNPPQTSSIQSAREIAADDVTANEILDKARAAATSARQKLATFRPNCKLAFLNRKEDGTTTLNVITPENVTDEDEASEHSNVMERKRPITLGDVLPRPKEGNPGLSPWSETPEKLLTPVTFLNYGPFASFAPSVDSTWATLDKDLSATLLATYAEPDAVEYAWSLRNFVSESGDYLIGMVDSLLDTLTNGEHSKIHGKAMDELQKAKKILRNVAEEEAGKEPIDWDGLRSLQDVGIDVSFLDSIGAPPAKAPTPLEETAALLGQLEEAQRWRLSQPPGLTLTNVRGPDQGEIELAGAVVQKLSSAAAAVKPEDVVGEKEIRDCLGIDDVDMDVLREFLVPE